MMCRSSASEGEILLMLAETGQSFHKSESCFNYTGSCSCEWQDPTYLDVGPYDFVSGSFDDEPPKKAAHATKFLCPRYAKFANAPSAKDSEMFIGGDGDVEIESCRWEIQVFEDRQPVVMCTDQVVVNDFNDGTYQINDFVIEPNSDLGCGSFCYFKLASCTEDKGLYAIKATSKSKAQKSSMLFSRSNNPFLNITRETLILKQINHPNIVKLFEIMDDPDEDGLFFVFEYMDRGSILTIPTDHPLSETLAVRHLRDILFGVEYLHNKRIIHRDLKPENILWNTFGRAKLIDFGLSFMHASGDDTTRLPYGTPSFTAPECVDENLEDGYSACAMEIWAIGITLYALVFGKVPYYDDNLYEIYRMIQQEELRLPTKVHISLDLRSLLAGMLTKNPDLRMQLPEALSRTMNMIKNSPNSVPDRCKTCVHYNPSSCHPKKL